MNTSKEKRKAVSYRIGATTTEKVRKDAAAANLSINDYVDSELAKAKPKKS